MSKDIPEIDDLTRGINDSELILTEDTAGTQVEQKENNNEIRIISLKRNSGTEAIAPLFFISGQIP